MSFLEDILPIINKHSLTLESKQQEIGNIVTYNFKFKENLTWKPGQHGLFSLDHVKIKKPSRMFSIASLPSEGIIKISMRMPPTPSEFKQALNQIKPGETLTLRGPVGNFYLKGPEPILLVAAGIGITPMRALLNNYIKQRDLYPGPIELFYLDDNSEFLYQDTLNELSALGDIHIKYLTNRETFYDELKNYVINHPGNSNYFISGPRPMVTSTKAALKQHGVKNKNIKNDPFIGTN